MRLKIKHCIIPMLMASVLILTSCDSENYLTQVSFDVTYSDFDFDFVNKTIELFCSREKMISFFTSDQHGMGNYFYSDLEEFENDYGFDNYAIVYYASAINAGYTLNLYISEISDESISLSFTYYIPDVDVLPAAIELVENFYLLERSNFNEDRTTIVYKFGDTIIKTEDYKEELYGS